MQATQALLQAGLTNLAGCLRLVNATAEPWTDAQRLRAILTRAVATCMLAPADPPALVTAYIDAT